MNYCQRGGIARAESMDHQRRKEIATKAAKTRWENPSVRVAARVPLRGILGSNASAYIVKGSKAEVLIEKTALFSILSCSEDDLMAMVGRQPDSPIAKTILDALSSEIPFSYDYRFRGVDARVLPLAASYVLSRKTSRPRPSKKCVASCERIAQVFRDSGVTESVKAAIGYSAGFSQTKRAAIKQIKASLQRWAGCIPDSFIDDAIRIEGCGFSVSGAIEYYIVNSMPEATPEARGSFESRAEYIVASFQQAGEKPLLRHIGMVCSAMAAASDRKGFSREMLRSRP